MTLPEPVSRSSAIAPRRPQYLLLGLLGLVLGLSLGLRLLHLERPLYWHDEAYTSLRVSGYTGTEVQQALFIGERVDREALASYLRPGPDRSVVDTLYSLATEDAQHPPLYYLMAWAWVRSIGDSAALIRLLSVLLGLLLFPAMYWLCQELFALAGPASPQPLAALTTGLALALVAVSPYHLLYAREAREYSLWAALVLLFSAAFVRALRLNTWAAWGQAAVFLALGLYSQPLMLILAGGCGFYLLVVERFRLSRRLLRGLLALAAGVLAFGPWLRIIQMFKAPGAGWTAVPVPVLNWLSGWAAHLIHGFWIPPGDGLGNFWSSCLGLPLLAVLLGWAAYRLYRTTPLRVWLFVAVLSLSVAIGLALPDIVLGGQRSLSGRYLVPLYLGLPLVLAYGLAEQLLRTPRRRWFWQGVTGLVLVVGLVSGAIGSQAETTWTKAINENLPAVANALNAEPQPLLISDYFSINFGNLLALSYRLAPQVQLLLIASPDIFHVPTLRPSDRSVFVLNPSDPFRQQLAQQAGGTLDLPVSDTHLFLWRLDRSAVKAT